MTTSLVAPTWHSSMTTRFWSCSGSRVITRLRGTGCSPRRRYSTMRHRRSGEGLLDFGELLSHRRALLAAALLLCAVTVAVGVVLFFRAPAGDHARAEQ